MKDVVVSTIVVLGVLLGRHEPALAAGVPGADLEEIVVTAKPLALPGKAISASQGSVPADQLRHRPILRTAELLEVIPGLIVTQHSGSGKANQFFLRGFNLDHGTDFASDVDGVPVNMPTHAHGQGYTDLNFLIPELIQGLEYSKGTYYAERGDFSAAGAVSIRYGRRLDAPILSLTVGEDRFSRTLLAGSRRIGGGDLLAGVEHQRTDGPWRLDEDLRRVNGLIKYSHGTRDAGWALTGQAYDGRWIATDQIPRRAVESGALDRFGFIDPTNGGNTHRYSLSLEAHADVGGGDWRALLYGIDYGLDLFSNFTYFTDPVNGDQFEQLDDRRVYGGDWRYRMPLDGFAHGAALAVGVQLRHDDIGSVGLYRTRERERLDTVRQDAVKQTSYAAFASVDLDWTDWLRTDFGLRADYYDFEVVDNRTLNSGSARDFIVSPKVSVKLGPWAGTEVFLNFGRGFHSNDARGTTIAVDPNDGVTPVERADPLVRATGAEVGFRTAVLPNTLLAASLWALELESELVFVGDLGTTEASRPTRRTGIELGAYWTPTDWMIVDADFAYSRPRFVDADPAGNRIPGAVERVASLGIALNDLNGWFGGARVRYLGPSALVEDNGTRAGSTKIVNLEAGYRFSKRLSGRLTVLNLFDAEVNDISYFYESQLRTENEPVADLHFHPAEPRTLRANLTLTF